MKRLVFILTIGMIGYGLAQTAFVYVEPETTIAQLGDSFTICFDIADVQNLYCWQIDFSWDPLLLHLIGLRDGPFLSDNGQKPSIFVTDYADTAIGHASMGATLIGMIIGTSGSGTLSYADFLVKQQYGSCPLTMYYVMLLDSSLADIPHTKRDGYFTTEGTGTVERNADDIPLLGTVITRAVDGLAFDYFVPEPAVVKIMLYDVSGRLIEVISNGPKDRGRNEASATVDLPGGIYFLRMEIGDRSLSRKLLVLR